ncbi:MAG: TIM barrel protein [Oscillospiraceae bacterium]
MSKALFGCAGVGSDFLQLGYGKDCDIPAYIAALGLDCCEYNCGRGVNIKEKDAKTLGEKALENGVTMSVHAPFYISLSGIDDSKRLGSLRYMEESAVAARAMGAKRIVIHSGSLQKQERGEALLLAKKTLEYCLGALDAKGLCDVSFCPELMGKINQLGSLDEVIELCLIDERLIPCIDFGHLNARTRGGLCDKSAYAEVLDRLESGLGRERAKSFHAHFSKIEYGAGGEKCHLTFADEVFGPDYRPFLELVADRGLYPVIICESAGTQGQDAAKMKEYYINYSKERRYNYDKN